MGAAIKRAVQAARATMTPRANAGEWEGMGTPSHGAFRRAGGLGCARDLGGFGVVARSGRRRTSPACHREDDGKHRSAMEGVDCWAGVRSCGLVVALAGFPLFIVVV